MSFEDDAVALAWGAWVELGVSGWSRTHEDWAIDPEPLILLTASLGDTDGRLQDEATDWCVRNWRSVSKVRLRNMAGRATPEVRAAYNSFVSTVNDASRASWPLATIPQALAIAPRRFTATGRSHAPDLAQPSMAWLRMRAIFGPTARTEILRLFASQPSGETTSVGRLTADACYARRIINDECDTLASAGVLSVQPVGNRFEYRLRRRAPLEALVGSIPAIRPSWPSLTSLTTKLVASERATATTTERVASVLASDSLSGLMVPLDRLGYEHGLRERRSRNHLQVLSDLGDRTLSRWAEGEWDGLRFEAQQRL